MAKLTRYLQKIFANNSDQVGVFGTGVDKETSKNVETLQSADYEGGWSEAIVTNKNYPIWQEMDGVQYGLSYQLKYLFQNGIPEWLSTETYYANTSFCQYGGKIYQSLQDDNTNHNPALDDGWWTVYIASDFANKDLSNVTNAGKSLACTWAFPSGTYETLTPVNAGQYTAPAYGWFQLAMRQTQTYNNSGIIEIYNQTKEYGTYIPAPYGSTYRVYLPVSKNDVVEIGFIGHAPAVGFTFHYAQGTEFEYTP